MRILKVYSLSESQVLTVLLTIVTILSVRSVDLIHPITESLYPLIGGNFSFLHPPVTTLLLSVSEFVYISHISEITKYVSIFVKHISVSVMSSRFIHVVTR